MHNTMRQEGALPMHANLKRPGGGDELISERRHALLACVKGRGHSIMGATRLGRGIQRGPPIQRTDSTT